MKKAAKSISEPIGGSPGTALRNGMSANSSVPRNPRAGPEQPEPAAGDVPRRDERGDSEAPHERHDEHREQDCARRTLYGALRRSAIRCGDGLGF